MVLLLEQGQATHESCYCIENPPEYSQNDSITNIANYLYLKINVVENLKDKL